MTFQPFDRSTAHSICAVLLCLAAAANPHGQAPPAPRAGEATFNIFVRGTQIGIERVTVSASDDGWLVSSSGKMVLGQPFVLNKFEVRYDRMWHPTTLSLEAVVREQPASLHTTFDAGTAVSRMVDGPKIIDDKDQVAPDTVVLPNNAFAAYEALALRIAQEGVGAQLPVYIAPQSEIRVRVDDVAAERIETGSGRIDVRRYAVTFLHPDRPVDAALWVDEGHRLVRVTLPALGVEVARADVSSVAARELTLTRPNDEEVVILANGFNLAATVSKPATATGPLPAIVLVSGAGYETRDETIAGVPIFAQLAGALADAGFLVVRYDKRGVGQSGGRPEAATIADYAEDVRAVVRYLDRRGDVNDDRIAVAGYGDGGWVAMQAAARDGDIAALVLLATPALSGTEVVLEQQRHALDQASVPDAEKTAKIELQKRIQTAVATGEGWDAIPPELRRQADTAWFRSYLAFDPAGLMRRVRQPVLVVHGALDKQVVPRHGEILAGLAREREREVDTDHVQLDGVNHLFVPAKSGEVREYGILEDRVITPALASAIRSWLDRTMPPRS